MNIVMIAIEQSNRGQITKVELRSVGEQIRDAGLNPTPADEVRIRTVLFPYVIGARDVMRELDLLLAFQYEDLPQEERNRLDWEGAVTLWRLEKMSGQLLDLLRDKK